MLTTRRLGKGSLILSEEPYCVIRKPADEITDEDIVLAFLPLNPSQRAQLSIIWDAMPSKILGLMFFQNVFLDLNPRPNESPTVGLYPINPRFNHSCVPNMRAPNHTGDTKESFATKDIDSGEEITFCYDPYGAHMTRSERHESLQHMGFACKCRACQLEAPFQQLSDLRRLLIRGAISCK